MSNRPALPPPQPDNPIFLPQNALSTYRPGEVTPWLIAANVPVSAWYESATGELHALWLKSSVDRFADRKAAVAKYAASLDAQAVA
jgi:hypothetical protein